MIKPILLTAACAAVFATSAFAGTTVKASKTVVPPEPLYGVGWYGAIQGGVNAYQETTGRNFNIGGNIANLRSASHVGGFGGLKLGYVFGTGNVRFAIEEDMFYNGIDAQIGGSLGGIAMRGVSSRLDTGAFLTNFIVRFNGLSKFQPYIGGGVGLYVGQGNDVAITAPAIAGGVPIGVRSSRSRTDLAWQLLAGFDYYFTPRVSTFLEYKFLNYEGAIIGSRVGQQLIGAGVRLHF
ncbi:MAG: hypothetical protein ABIP85_22150 [Chthoniobacteraceae bacterium]